MRYKIQYTDDLDRQRIMDENTDKQLIEEHNIAEGNFLVFTDMLAQTTLEELKENQLILMDVMATMYEDMLAKGTV